MYIYAPSSLSKLNSTIIYNMEIFNSTWNLLSFLGKLNSPI